MRVLAVIPSRSGSKRMPRKNYLEIEPGVTLAQQAVDCAANCGLINHVWLATDDNAMSCLRAKHYRLSPELTADNSDISAVTANCLEHAERQFGTFDYVVTLQPAVLARSPLIVKRMLEAMDKTDAKGAVTAARTVPWQWSIKGLSASNSWHPGPYPRSQNTGHHLAEINAVQIARADVVREKRRWDLPLILFELPPWCAALDVDDPEDLAMAREIWPWAKPRLETWEPRPHPFTTINGDFE